MNIVIENCNSIDSAEITIEPNKLNIKYGMNGTGKSTIAKALELNAKDADLSSLMPFKLNRESELQPTIRGADSFKTVAIFNEGYIDQFVFKQDEVIQNSFNIFIKNKDYDQRMKAIENLISELRDAFRQDQTLGDFIKDLTALSDAFGSSKTKISKSGKIGKGLGEGNKIEHIPDGLGVYKDFIGSENNWQWIKWQIEGNGFLDISSSCPYCTSPIQDKKDIIRLIEDEYDHNSIKHLATICEIVERLGKYFNEETRTKIQEIIKNRTKPTKEEEGYLIILRTNIDTLKEKLIDMRDMSYFLLRDAENVTNEIGNLKVDISLLSSLDSEETNEIIAPLNDSLEVLISKATDLQAKVGQQKTSIKKTIEKYRGDINNFLKYAGYRYKVDIENDDKTYKMKLKHEDSTESIKNATSHLSYGERNAFSLVLFMYETLAKNPDLIILDDPISSFDRNKKFAIIEMLFRKKKSFKGKSVLLMTHDIEPIIDMVKSLSHKFYPTPTAHFLESKLGEVKEIEVNKGDIISFTQVCDDNIREHKDDIIKLIYLRRYYEILDDKGLEYQLLSNLFHKRDEPFIKDGSNKTKMTDEQIEVASESIKEKLPRFDYTNLLQRINDRPNMMAIYHATNNNYEKLQLFRMINDQNHESDVLKKYINETFHIENEYVMQLNPHKYDFVPEYIVAECDKVFAEP